MAEVKPLKLRSQKAPTQVVGASELPFASVLVDTGVLHLSEPFDYLVPEKFSDAALPGTLVKVPFNSAFTQGYVIERKTESEVAKVKAIESVISPLPIFTPDLHELLKKVAHRYACNIWDVVRNAIAPRVASVEKSFATSVSSSRSERPITHEYFALGRSAHSFHALITELVRRSQDSQIAIIVPDERDIHRVERSMKVLGATSYVVLGTHLEKSERYRAFLSATFDAPKFIIGTRSAIFTPLAPGSTICIVKDGEESLYEKRTPGWNVRDVALLRAHEASLIFASYSPSLEIARLTDTGWLKERAMGDSAPMRFTFAESRDSHNAVISRALKNGSVLITLATPGYVASFSCQKCRNMAICECGGRLSFTGAKVPTCAICQKTFSDWRCTWCGEQQPRAIRRGTDRYAEEFGRAFPNVRILVSNASHPIYELPEERSLVLATNGCEPEGEYAAVVLLDGEILMNRAELRGDESARKHWASAISMALPNGEVFLSLPAAHPTSQAFEKWSNIELAIKECKERAEAHLPPEYRIALLEGDSKEISKIALALESKSNLIGAMLVPVDSLNTRLILRAKVADSGEFSNFLYDLLRYRSLKGSPNIKVRIDPFNI